MTTDHEHSNPAGLTRRQVLKVAGVTLGAMSAGRQAWAQAPKPGGSFVSAQTTEATGLDPQLVPALSRSRRSPMMYSQLVRFDGDALRYEARTATGELFDSFELHKRPDGTNELVETLAVKGGRSRAYGNAAAAVVILAAVLLGVRWAFKR